MGTLMLEDDYGGRNIVQLSIIERSGNGTNVLEIPEFVVVITMFF